MVYIEATHIVVVKPFMCRGELVAAGVSLNPAQIRAIKRIDKLLSNGTLKAVPDPYSRKATKSGTSAPTHLHPDVLSELLATDLTARFTVDNTDLQGEFDGTTSSVSAPQTIANYIWDYGDGSAPATNVTPTSVHTYDEAGTYTVTLRITGSLGAVSEPVSHDVVVTAP